MREKTGGRKIGSSNKYTFNVKMKLSESVDSEFVENIFTDIAAIESPKDRVMAKIRLIEFFVPKAIDPIENERKQLFDEEFIKRFFPE